MKPHFYTTNNQSEPPAPSPWTRDHGPRATFHSPLSILPAPDSSILDDIYALERDPGVRTLIRNGWTMGCFYIESPSMRSLFEKLHCDTFEGVVAASSIIRPGVAESGMMQEYVARATGRRKVTYLHPVMEEVLGGTYGVMVYQEDVLKVAHAIGGLTLSEADLLRRAMSGKSRSKNAMERLQVKFFASCRQRGLDDRLTGEIWRQIESFAAYSFCKGHSAAFAVLSFQMAWFKAHHPAEFLAGVIANGGGFYSTAAYVQEARRLDIVVEGPCINRSHLDWWALTFRHPNQPEWWQRKQRTKNQGAGVGDRGSGKTNHQTRTTDNGPRTPDHKPQATDTTPTTNNQQQITNNKYPTGLIRAGLLAIAGLSPELVTRILKARDAHGFYCNPEDFWSRARPTPDEAQRLILCGACDAFGLPRAPLMIRHALWQRAQDHDSPLAPWSGELPDWAQEKVGIKN